MPVPRTRRRLALGVAAVPLLLAGCAGTQPAAGGSGVAAHGAPTTAQGVPAAAHEASSGGPPESAKMICGEETKAKVAQALRLPGPPPTAATWADSVYTCTYTLPMGPMVLSVAVAPDDATAGRQFGGLAAKLPGSSPLIGLGERSQETPDGTVEVLKDNQILTVDDTRLPAVFGPEGSTRGDFAYEVASDVLGCWTGNG